jgi:hypothetical protein
VDIEYKKFMYGSGSIADLDQFFGGRLRVDPPLRELLISRDGWKVEGLGLDIAQAEKGVSDREIITRYLVFEGHFRADVSYIFAVLAYLDSENGHEALKIPEGDDETDVIVCYASDNVVYLEHEFEAGKEEEWHLHMRPKKTEWKRAPKVVITTSTV